MSENRLIKQKSGFIRSKKHMFLNDNSSIIETDVLTTSKNISDDKNVVYNEGNFIISINYDNTLITNSYNNGSWVSDDYLLTGDYLEAKKFKISDLSDSEVKERVNGDIIYEYRLNNNDIKTFASYGSAFKLFNYSIINIINKFPASLHVYDINDYSSDLYIIDKDVDGSIFITIPFSNIINKFDINIYNKSTNNSIRDFLYNYMSYVIELNGKNIEIKECIKGAESLDLLLNTQDESLFDKKTPFHIKPKEQFYSEFIDNLSDFESVLLNEKSLPKKYTSHLVLPINNDGDIYFNVFRFTWETSDGYNIDIDTPSFIENINTINNGVLLLDSYFSDFMYRAMTHESIKEYDFIDETLPLFNQGTIKSIISIYGANFDSIKNSIKSLSFVNTHNFNQIEGFDTNLYFLKLKEIGWDGIGLNLKYDSKLEVNYGSVIEKYSSFSAENEFNRRLFLVSKELFKTKGTIKCIELMLGMLGINSNDFILNEYSVGFSGLLPSNHEGGEMLERIKFLNKLLYKNNKNVIKLLENNPLMGLPIKEDFVKLHIIPCNNNTIITDRYVNINGEIVEVLRNDISQELFREDNLIFFCLDENDKPFPIPKDYETIPNLKIMCVIRSTEPIYENGEIKHIVGKPYIFTPRINVIKFDEYGCSVYKSDGVFNEKSIILKYDELNKNNFKIFSNYSIIFYVETGDVMGVPNPLENTPKLYFQSKGYWYKTSDGIGDSKLIVNSNNPHSGEEYGIKTEYFEDILNKSEYFNQFSEIFGFLSDSDCGREYYENYEYIDEDGVKKTINFFEMDINGVKNKIGFTKKHLYGGVKIDTINTLGVYAGSLYEINRIINLMNESLNYPIVKLNSKIIRLTFNDYIFKENKFMRNFLKNIVIKYIEQIIPSTTMLYIDDFIE